MDHDRRRERRRAAAIRRGDCSTYTALRWVAILFKSAAVFLVVAIFAECVAGVRADGWSVFPYLLGELARATVIAILLWAGGDLIRLLLQLGRDVRAERVLLARIAYRTSSLGEESVSLLPEQAVGDELLEGEVSGIEGAAPEGVRLRWHGENPPDRSIAPRSP